jgi:hypothetical protein
MPWGMFNEPKKERERRARGEKKKNKQQREARRRWDKRISPGWDDPKDLD